jgi:hypothetical protein
MPPFKPRFSVAFKGENESPIDVAIELYTPFTFTGVVLRLVDMVTIAMATCP